MNQTSQTQKLLSDRRFWPLFWTQFLGAFNDNVFKNALVIMITYKSYSLAGLRAEQMVSLAGGIFILPFFLFSALGGQFADKWSKTRLIFWVKAMEVFIMALGTVGFIFSSLTLLLGTLFLMGLQSTFFGPVKYSILPDLLHRDELVKGNAYIELGTFLSILLGTILGGLLIGMGEQGGAWVGLTTVVLAILGLWTGSKVQAIPPARPELKVQWDPVRPTWEILRMLPKSRSVFLSVLGISWFWFLGAAILSMLPPFCKDYLRSSEQLVTFFLALFSVGVGVGSLLCDKLSFRKLELGLVPIGSAGISAFLIDLYFSSLAFQDVSGAMSTPVSVSAFLSTFEGWKITLDLLLFSLLSGFFIVPLYVLIQERSDAGERSRIIAGNNILNALLMVVSAVGLAALYSTGLTLPQIFLVFAGLNALVAIYIYTVLPEFLYRFICWIVANILYRIRVQGAHNIPEEGPALLVCNHVSFVDWLIISSATQRPIRFVMHHSFMKIPILKWIFRDAKVIPIAGAKENSETMNRAFERISEELRAGELVCLFPEGELTRDGEMNIFRPGVERALRETPVPVVPMALIGLWGSIFSRKDSVAKKRPFKRVWSKVALMIGESQEGEKVSAGSLQNDVAKLFDSVN